MMTLRSLFAVSLVALGACSSSSSEGTGSKGNEPPAPTASVAPTTPPTTTPTSTATTPPGSPAGDYTFRFEGFSAAQYKYGVRFGSTTNLRFAFDLQKKEQTFTPPPASDLFNPGNTEGQITPKLITGFELGGYCQEGGTQYGNLDLPPGDVAWVDHLDLTMTSQADVPADGSAPEKPGFNAMCYGYRLNGTWYWELKPQHATWDTATRTYQLRFTIQKGPLDAIKVLSNNGQANRYLNQMVLATKPQ